MNHEDVTRCVAGILVGGRNTRMGRPKATLPLPDGRTLVEHVAGVASRLRRWIEEVVILGFGRELPDSLGGLRILPDYDPGAGPLAGLCSLLGFADRRWSLLLACDLPRLQPAVLERLFAATTPDCNAVAFRRPACPDTWHACCALYHPRLLPAALLGLEQGGRSLQKLLASTSVIPIDPCPEEHRMLLNVNTPEDYDLLFRDAPSETCNPPVRRWEEGVRFETHPRGAQRPSPNRQENPRPDPGPCTPRR